MLERDANCGSLYGFGFEEPIRAIVLGARGGIGQALAGLVLSAHPDNRALLTTRKPTLDLHAPEGAAWCRLDVTKDEDWDELREVARGFIEGHGGAFNFIINATGALHDTSGLVPERALRMIDSAQMMKSFAVNACAVAIALKELTPLLPRRSRAIFASLSARVGSISDNQIGGWYSYRAAKAAQNMLIKTASIELARTQKQTICVGLHPGTVHTELSAPFAGNVKHTVFTPEQSATYLMDVLSHLTPQETGGCYAWDGERIPE